MRRQNLFKGAMILVLASIISKIFSASFKIPLVSILKTDGIGLFQLVFPIFALLIVICTGGIPLAESKMIARSSTREQKRTIFIWTFFTESILGLLFCILLLAFSNLISSAYNIKEVAKIIRIIAPAVFICSIIGVFRGFFQGQKNMIPTATSQIVEQFFKFIFGILFAWLFAKKSISLGVCGAMFGIVLSEVLALVCLYIYFIYSKDRWVVTSNEKNSVSFKQFFKTSLYFTISACILPFVSFVDSFLAIKLLVLSGNSVIESTKLFGIMSGIVGSLIALPCLFSNAISTALIPNLKKNDMSQLSNCFVFTLLVCLPCAASFAIFPDRILSLIFPVIKEDSNFSIACKILQISSLNALFLPLLNVAVAVLQACGKVKLSSLFLGLTGAIKIILAVCYVLVGNCGILGYTLAGVVSNFFGMSLCLVFIKWEKKKNSYQILKLLACNEIMCLLFIIVQKINLQTNYFMLVAFCLILIYIALLKLFKLFDVFRLKFYTNSSTS